MRVRKHWNYLEAVALCKLVEKYAPACGCHVALSGGLLYKSGPRKDADLVFYRHRKAPVMNKTALLAVLGQNGFKVRADHGFCVKATYRGKDVDLLFPESYDADTYPEEDAELEVELNVTSESQALVVQQVAQE